MGGLGDLHLQACMRCKVQDHFTYEDFTTVHDSEMLKLWADKKERRLFRKFDA